MAKDFRATQVETTKIILSGGIASSTIGGIIYSGSVATNRSGGIPTSMLSDVGTDVFLFVSGTKSNSDFTRAGVTLFGGDIVVSGTMYAERQVIEVDGIIDGDLIVTGNLLVKPDTNSSVSADFRNAANASLLRVDTSGNSVVINEESNNFNFRVETNTKTHALFTKAASDQVLILSGGAAASYDESSGNDVNFYVSGTVGSKGTSVRGATVFGGDLVVSGSTTIGTVAGDLLPSIDDTYDLGSASLAWQDLFLEGDITLTDAGTIAAIAGDLSIIAGGGSNNVVIKGDLVPQADDTYDLGSAALAWQDLHLEGDVLITDAGKVETAAGALTVSAVGGPVVIDANTSIVLDADDKNIIFKDAGVTRGSIIANANLTISSSATADIVLDTSGTSFKFDKSGTFFFNITNSSNDTVLQPQVTDKDIIFKEDGGNEIARFDSSLESLAMVTNKRISFDGVTSNTEFISGDGIDLSIGSSNRVLIMSGGSPSSINESAYPDVNFFVSGSIGSKGTAVKGTSLFGGDHVVSGSAVTLAGVYRNTAFKTSNFNVASNDHFLLIDSNAGHVTASLQTAALAGSGRVFTFKDVAGYAGSAANRIVIKPAGSDKLEGIADETKIAVTSGSISIISDGVGQYYIFGERD